MSEILARVIEDASRTGVGCLRETPEGIRRLLRRCLQKDRKLRLRDIGDARIEIEEARSKAPTDSHSGERVTDAGSGLHGLSRSGGR